MSTSARREHGREVQRMIETKIREYLLSNVYTAIYLETPKTMPDECVIFRIIDRSWSNLIDTVTVEINSYAKTKEEAADAACKAVRDLAIEVGIPQHLTELGIKEEDIPALAEQAIADVCTPGNPREVTYEDIVELYKKVL